MKKIKTEDEYGAVEITSNENFAHITDYIDKLIYPCLLGIGFSKTLIDKFIISEVWNDEH